MIDVGDDAREFHVNDRDRLIVSYHHPRFFTFYIVTRLEDGRTVAEFVSLSPEQVLDIMRCLASKIWEYYTEKIKMVEERFKRTGEEHLERRVEQLKRIKTIMEDLGTMPCP